MTTTIQNTQNQQIPTLDVCLTNVHNLVVNTVAIIVLDQIPTLDVCLTNVHNLVVNTVAIIVLDQTKCTDI